MFEFLEKLRQKPERVKKQIAFLAAFFLVGIIFVIWLSVIYPDFRQDQSRKETVSKLEPSPLGAFGETFKTGISSISEEFGKLKESISTFSANSVYYSTTTDSIIISTTTPDQ